MTASPRLLARGSWAPAQVETRWRPDAYEVPPEIDRLADAAVEGLRERGSPCHDGLAGRLAGYEVSDERLLLQLQPSRWSLRLVEDGASDSLTALCVVRAADGRWLAGRRARWLATWANRWTLGAGGAVEIGESPAETLARELEEEWQLVPEHLSVEALVSLPNRLSMLIGLATVSDAAQPVPDDEHDEFSWWPADVGRWPQDADERLRRMATLLAAGVR